MNTNNNFPTMPSSTPSDPWPLPELTRARRAIVVVDVVESVRLMQEDEAGFIERWRRFVHQVRTEVLPKHGGRLVKSLGDGMLLEFEGVPQAVQAALWMQSKHPLGHGEQVGANVQPLLGLRTGIHVADVTIDQVDIYGHGVNLAARLTTLAMPGEIVASADARDALTDGIDAIVEDIGECHVKHVGAPVRAFRIGAAGVPMRIGSPKLDDPRHWTPAVAVVPFSHRSPTDTHDVLGDVIADEVIAALSRAPHLRVISRLSTRAFKGRDVGCQEIGRHLGSAYVISGTYHVDGGKLRMQVELAGTDDASVLWSDTLQGDVLLLFRGSSDLVNELCAEVARAVLCEEVARAGRRAMPNQESYTLLMAAIHLMHRNAQHDFERGREMLDHLIERNPDEPLPRAWLGKWYGIRAAQGWTTNPIDDARQALAHVQRALDSDPGNSLAWAIKGLIHSYINKDMTNARVAYDAALAANPSESLAWLYSATLNAWQDHGEGAVEAAANAQRLSPLDPLKYYYDSLSATAFLVAGEHEVAIELARRSLRQNRSHTSTHRTLAIAQALSGQLDDARSTAREMLHLDPAFTVTAFRKRYPGRDSTHAESFCRALLEAGVPD